MLKFEKYSPVTDGRAEEKKNLHEAIKTSVATS